MHNFMANIRTEIPISALIPITQTKQAPECAELARPTEIGKPRTRVYMVMLLEAPGPASELGAIVTR